MSTYLKFSIVVILFFLLILVRAFASDLFYDPFAEYFKNDYLYKEIPKIRIGKFFAHIFFRYLLNTIISIGIIVTLYKKQYLKFSLQFYSITFVVLACLLLTMYYLPVFSNFTLFYVRRFLIHPIFILLLIPAFYYQRKNA